MEQYIAIIKDDIKRFIKNYLIAGELVDMTGMSDLEEYIPSKYPYLSILFLLKQNGLNKDETWFVENYNSQLIDETGELKKSLGHFLYNKNDVEALTAQLLEMKNQVNSLSQERDELKIQKQELKSQNISLEEENVMLKQKVDDLTSMIEKLESSLNSPKATIYPSPETKSQPDVNQTSIDKTKSLNIVDMGTSVLWCTSNLGAENDWCLGDYFSWGALEDCSFFAHDADGYDKVFYKNIAGNEKYDAALNKRGTGYRIPTDEDWRALLEVCDYPYKTIKKNGLWFIELRSRKTHNQLFLPVIGHMEKEDICNVGVAEYWSSVQYSGKSAYIFRAKENGQWEIDIIAKWCGLQIRPIYSEIDQNTDNLPEATTISSFSLFSKILSRQISQVAKQIAKDNEMFTRINNPVNYNKKYPPKEKINMSNVFVEIIRDCLPHGKSVFENDPINSSGLDFDKLNAILSSEYKVEPISKQSFYRMTFKDLKIRIVSLLAD